MNAALDDVTSMARNRIVRPIDSGLVIVVSAIVHIVVIISIIIVKVMI